MKTISKFLCVALMALSLFGCGSFDTQAWLNKPSVQAEIQHLQDFVFKEALALLGGLFSRGYTIATVDDTANINALVAKAQAKYPDVPKDAVEQSVRIAYAQAKISKHR